jgi:hypothetical protein
MSFRDMLVKKNEDIYNDPNHEYNHFEKEWNERELKRIQEKKIYKNNIPFKIELFKIMFLFTCVWTFILVILFLIIQELNKIFD